MEKNPTDKTNLNNLDKQPKNKKKTVQQNPDISNELNLLHEAPIANKSKEIDEEVVVKVKKKKRKKDKAEEVKVIRYLETDIAEGLSSETVEERKKEGLTNKSSQTKGKSIIRIIFSNMFTFFNMLYATITALFIILGSYENLLFLATIIPNLVIGIYQEIKAKIMIDKLKLMQSPTATVIRDSSKLEIPVEELVLDDIVLFSSGDQISSDSIVLDGFAELNESLLTGEADLVEKNKGNELLSGSFVVSGVVVARVNKVGKDNYIEKISKDAKTYGDPNSQLLNTLNLIVKIVSIIILPLAILTYITTSKGAIIDFLGIVNKDGLIRAASSTLAMIPAGLFLLTSAALFVSVARLARQRTLVQKMYCIEMLARVDVLCLDKTGTITDGTMRVSDCVELKNHTNYTVREIMGSMMNTFSDVNPTSEALIKFFDKNTLLKPIEEIPFSSKRKFSSVTFEGEGTFIIGAPEFVLQEGYDKIVARVDAFAAEGNRVLVLAHTNAKVKADHLPKTIKPLAIISIEDNIRPDAADTIDYFKSHGVDVKVISGDNPRTVSEIAAKAGIEGADRYVSLAGMTDDEIRASIFDYNVFGRVSPEQKRTLVRALKSHKKTVAMTGDGVNDILALKEADISIAMASGSDATKYVSHLVLMDSNFSSMPKVVQEGRRVINNIQKTSTLFLVKTIFSILLTVLYIILGSQNGDIKMGYPFTAQNLYIIEWFAIGIPATFLALQKNEELVKGKFGTNIVTATLPGAITILVLHILLSFVRIIPGFEQFQSNNEAFTTIATVITSFVMLVVLFNVSKPFNLFRRLLYFSMLVLSVLTILDILPVMKVNVSYRRSAEDYTNSIVIEVDNDGYWLLEDPLQEDPYRGSKAILNPEVDIDSSDSDKYIMPVLGVLNGYWSLDGFQTKVFAKNGVELNISVKGSFWYINGEKTKARTYSKPNIIYLDGADKIYFEPKINLYKGYWVIEGIVTKIKATNDSTLRFEVSYWGDWEVNGVRTDILAIKQNLKEGDYILPLIEIEEFNNIRYYRINGKRTTIEADAAESTELTVQGNYWYINSQDTGERARTVLDKDPNDISDYVKPILGINRKGNFVLNGEDTDLHAKDNLLVMEILITILFILIVDPIIKLLYRIFKRSADFMIE